LKEFSRVSFESLSDSDREIKLEELKQYLCKRLSEKLEHKDYFDEVYSIIQEFKAIGHDLWNWEYDGDSTALWGGDYMQPKTMGRLQLEFIFQTTVNVYWLNQSEEG